MARAACRTAIPAVTVTALMMRFLIRPRSRLSCTWPARKCFQADQASWPALRRICWRRSGGCLTRETRADGGMNSNRLCTGRGSCRTTLCTARPDRCCTDPVREGHRAEEPTPQGPGPGPHLVRDRRAGQRTPRLGPPCPSSTAPHAAGNPGASGSDWPPARPRTRLSQPERPDDRREHQWTSGTTLTRRDSRPARHGPALKAAQRPPPQATDSRSRNVEVR